MPLNQFTDIVGIRPTLSIFIPPNSDFLNDGEVLSYMIRRLPFHKVRSMKKIIIINLQFTQLVFKAEISKTLNKFFSLKAFW